MSSTTRSAASGPSTCEVYGYAEPRVSAPAPLRILNEETSLGPQVIAFARAIGEPLLPHQEIAVMRLLELHPDTGRLRFRYGLIQAARQNAKTHLARMLTLWRMYMSSNPQTILGVAQDLSQSAYAWELALRTAENCRWLAPSIVLKSRASGQYRFRLATGAEYTIRSANARAGRGLTCGMVVFDELRTQEAGDGWSSVTSTITASPNGQVIALTNAGSDKSTVLNNLYAAGIAGGADSRILVMSWEAPPGCDLDDIEGIRHANPCLGHLFGLDVIQAQRQALSPEEFRSECLNQRVVALNSAVDLEAWAACADAGGTLDAHRGQVAACFDSFGDHAVLAAAARLPDGMVRVELVRSWDSAATARTELPGLLDRVKPRKLGWFPNAGAGFAPILRIRRGSTEITGPAVAEACMGLASLAAARQLVHSDDPLLNKHVAAAEKGPAGDAYRFVRRGSHGSITAAYAAAGAVHLVMSEPPPQRARVRIVGLCRCCRRDGARMVTTPSDYHAESPQDGYHP